MTNKEKLRLINRVKSLVKLERIDMHNITDLQKNDIIVVLFDENHQNYWLHKHFLLVERVIKNIVDKELLIVKRIYPDNEKIVRSYFDVCDDYLGFVSYKAVPKLRLYMILHRYVKAL